jgi:hypothetical protein
VLVCRIVFFISLIFLFRRHVFRNKNRVSHLILPRSSVQHVQIKRQSTQVNPPKKPKKINQDLEEYLFQEDSDEELDETIKTLEMELKDKPISSGKRKAPSINIKDYEVLEAEEAKSKKQKAAKEPQTNPRYVWNSSESACLKLLVLGSSPLGKNSASMSKQYLLKINRTLSLNT